MKATVHLQLNFNMFFLSLTENEKSLEGGAPYPIIPIVRKLPRHLADARRALC